MGLKRYVITPVGYDGEVFEADSPGKAKMAAYRILHEMTGMTFQQFVTGLYVLHLGPVRAAQIQEGRDDG